MSKALSKSRGSSESTGCISSGAGRVRSSRRLMLGGTGGGVDHGGAGHDDGGVGGGGVRGRMSKALSKSRGSSESTGWISSGAGRVRSSRRLMLGGTGGGADHGGAGHDDGGVDGGGVGGGGVGGGVAGWKVLGVMVRMAARSGSPRGTSAPQVAQTRPPRFTPSHSRQRHTALTMGRSSGGSPGQLADQSADQPARWRPGCGRRPGRRTRGGTKPLAAQAAGRSPS